MFNRLDHIAIIVEDTDAALGFYRDTLGLPLLFSEVLEEQAVRLTHLDLGAVQLQLVEPLSEAHPLREAYRRSGESLHHLCFLVDDLPHAVAELSSYGLASRDVALRRGPRGRQAAFIEPATTRGVLLELTGAPEVK